MDVPKARNCLRQLQREYRLHHTNAIDVMYSLAMEAFNCLDEEKTAYVSTGNGACQKTEA